MRKSSIRSIIFFLTVLMVSTTASAQKKSMTNSYIEYIEQYSNTAIDHQKRYRIPASITLAQALLESSAGKSLLASQANNHFGIKCGGNWYGKKVSYDDDRRNECFRKYRSVEESYEDHSRFLSQKARYSSLFELDPTDYKAWAYGLRNAGYATDRKYGDKLIKIIEDFDLHKFDIGLKSDMRIMNSEKNQKEYKWGNGGEPIALSGHNIYRNNGVKCIFAEAGDSYASIANEFRIKESKLLKYNDLYSSRPLEEKTIVYLSVKKNSAEREFETHTIKSGETMRGVAQKYAIKLETLYNINDMPYDQSAHIGQVLKLRR